MLSLRTSAIALAAASLVLALPSTARAANATAQYYGGHVVSHAEVVPVMWGPNVNNDVVSGAEKFYTTLLSSPYMDWLGEYDTAGLNGVADGKPGSNQRIHRGKAQPVVMYTPKNTNTTLADMDIQNELLAAIASGALPKPHVDADGAVDTIYVFSFPPSIIVKDFTGTDACAVSCAYHWTVQAPGISAGVPYAIVPDCSKNTKSYCNMSTVFGTYTADASHELTEAITDPECALTPTAAATRPLGWFAPNQPDDEGEIADLCLSDPNAFTTYLGYSVQAVWSQRLGKCITNDPSLTLCDGNKHPCRPCEQSDCSGATPTCDVDPTSATEGQCIGTRSNGGGGNGTGGTNGSGGGSSNGSGSGDGSGSGAGSGGSSTGTDGTSGGTAPTSQAGGCGIAFGGGGEPASGALIALLALVARKRRRAMKAQRIS
jgi:hypothetical protein